ncbi:hypothetical protein D3C71_1970780 [compost metagenome]
MSGRLQREHRLLDHLQRRCAALARLFQALTQVGGEMAARHELVRQHLARHIGNRLAVDQVIQEIRRLIGQPAHLAGRHVEQVLRPRRGVGDAFGQRRRRLEQHDA